MIDENEGRDNSNIWEPNVRFYLLTISMLLMAPVQVAKPIYQSLSAPKFRHMI